MRKLILASASPRRREILEKLGIPFVVDVGDCAEDMSLPFKPIDMVKRFALGKAESVAFKYKDAVVIGADTVIEYNKKAIGKPLTIERTREILKMLSGKTHMVHTGFCIIDTRSGKRRVGTATTKVSFRKISAAEIAAYATTKESLHAAGGYMIQGRAAGFVARVDGDYFNIVGFPLATIAPLLALHGIRNF